MLLLLEEAQAAPRLAVHEGLLRQLNEDEIKGVIAHELGHVKHKDYIVMTVLSALPMIAYLISRAALYGGVFAGGGRRNNKDNSGAALIIIGVHSFRNLHNNIPYCHEA